MPSIPVCWLTAKLKGETVNVFSKPELKAERILAMIMMEYEDIQEPWMGINLSYMGTFTKDNSPF
jgi:hypothetical protein